MSDGALEVEDGTNGGDIGMRWGSNALGPDGSGVEEVNLSLRSDSDSKSRILVRESTVSHDGATILQRCCRFRSNASQTGTIARWGGARAGVGPYN